MKIRGRSYCVVVLLVEVCKYIYVLNARMVENVSNLYFFFLFLSLRYIRHIKSRGAPKQRETTYRFAGIENIREGKNNNARGAEKTERMKEKKEREQERKRERERQTKR